MDFFIVISNTIYFQLNPAGEPVPAVPNLCFWIHVLPQMPIGIFFSNDLRF